MKPSRRDVLRASALAAVSAFGGCSAFDAETRGLELGPVLVRNAYPNPHTVRIEVVRDGDPLREETVTVPGDDGTEILQATWSRAPAVYTLGYAVVGPNVKFDVRTTTLTAADERAPDQACAVPAITLLPNEPPYVQVGNAETMGPDCPRRTEVRARTAPYHHGRTRN